MEDTGKMGKRIGLLPVASLAIALSFPGCGGGDKTGLFSDPPPTTTTPPIAQIFFTDNAAGAARGTLYAVDTSNPTQPAIYTDNVNRPSMRLAYSGNFDAAGQTVSGVAPYALVYEQAGSLYRVDGNLSRRRISQGGIADNLFELSLLQDTADPEKSWIVFRNGVERKAVRLGTADTAPPISVPGTGLWDIRSAAGSVSGWLIADGGALRHRNLDFSDLRFVMNVTTSAHLLGRFSSGDLLLRVDGRVFIYYPEPRALSGLLYTFNNPDIIPWTSTESGSSIWFSDGANILKVENSGYGTIPISTSVVDDATADVWISEILPTDGGNVVYLRRSTISNAATISSVPASGGSGTVIEVADGVSSSIGNVNVAGNRVYYSLSDASGARSAINVLSDNSSRVSIGDSYWSGATAPDTFPASGHLPIDRIFLVRMDPTVGLDNATVISYAASTFADPLTLGALTPDPGESIADFSIGWNIGPRLLGTAIVGSQSDVYYLDAVTPGSLKRVLKTPNLSETPIDPID